jgi:hypothetical protein
MLYKVTVAARIVGTKKLNRPKRLLSNDSRRIAIHEKKAHLDATHGLAFRETKRP